MDKYACPECEGSGECECGSCGQDTTCTACDGSGIDDKVVDVEAFDAAKREMWKLHGGCSWVLEEGDQDVGVAGGELSTESRRNPAWKLYYRDFERKDAAKV